jgi:hypothetical protein
MLTTRLLAAHVFALVLAATDIAWGITAVSDTGQVKNTVLSITVTGAAGPITVTDDLTGVELVPGSQTGTGTRLLEYSGVASTTPRKGQVIVITDGVMTMNYTVTTSLGLKGISGANAPPIRSDYFIDPPGSALALTLPDGSTANFTLSGQFVKLDVSVDGRVTEPTFGDELFHLPDELFSVTGTGSLGSIAIGLPFDVPGQINLANIWNNLASVTATGIDLSIPLFMNVPGFGPINVDGQFLGQIDFSEDLAGKPSGFGEVISGIYTGAAATPLGTIMVNGTLQATGNSAPVPEPSTLLLLGSGLAGLIICGGKRWLKNV